MNTTAENETILLSKKGMKELKKAVVQLERDKNKILQSLREIERRQGHDEKIYRIEKLAELDLIEAEIDDKKAVLEKAKLLPKKHSHLRVAIGSVVDLIDKSGKLFHFTLVDSVEANPTEGRISTQSPIGQSLVGHVARDTIKWTTKSKTYRLKLIRVH